MTNEPLTHVESFTVVFDNRGRKISSEELWKVLRNTVQYADCMITVFDQHSEDDYGYRAPQGPNRQD